MADSTTEELEQRAELAEQAHVCAAEERDFLRGRVAELEAKLQAAEQMHRLSALGHEQMFAEAQKANARAEAAEALAEQYRKDATRYRWLRSKNVGDGYQQGLAAGCLCTANGDEMDAAIDNAIQKESGNG